MEYRQLGRTDIRVSEICLGTMTYGEQNTTSEAFAQLDCAVQHGVNFIDTAEMYPVPPKAETYTQTEVILGQWLKARGRSDDLIIATKLAGPGFPYMNGGRMMTPEHLQQGVEGSLKRLGVDCIDLYQLHWPDRNTNFFGQLGFSPKPDDHATAVEETKGALDNLVQTGKIRHYGLSNETPWGAMEHLRISGERLMSRPVSIQNPYNLLNRTFEIGLAEISHREQLGLLAYSPIAFGCLSGKYLKGVMPEKSRLALFDRFTRYSSPQAEKATEAYVSLAREFSLDPAQMALAFVSSRFFVTSTIIGATTLEQLETDLQSTGVSLSDELLEAIECIHKKNANPAP